MKKKLLIVGLVIVLIMTIFNINISNAATGTAEVTLEPSTLEVEQGGTFTIKVLASCDNGIGGLDTKYTYDDDELELVSANVLDSRKFAIVLSEEYKNISILASQQDTSSEEIELFEMKFKIKDDVAVGTDILLNLEDMEIYDSTVLSDGDYNAEDVSYPIETKTATIRVIEKASETPTTNEPTTNEPTTNEPTTSEPTASTPTTTTTSSTTGSTTSQNGTKTTTKSSDTVDKTTTTGKMPQTGINSIVIILGISITAVMVIVLFIKNKKYSKI